MKTTILDVTVCTFQRKKSSKTESGLMVNGDQIIIDCNAKPVPAPIYNYTLMTFEGYVKFHLWQPYPGKKG